MGSLSLTGQPKYHQGMQPLIEGVRFIDFNDVAALDRAVTDETAAVIFEPVQAEGGIIVATPEFVEGARKICDERGAPDQRETVTGKRPLGLASGFAGAARPRFRRGDHSPGSNGAADASSSGSISCSTVCCAFSSTP